MIQQISIGFGATLLIFFKKRQTRSKRKRNGSYIWVIMKDVPKTFLDKNFCLWHSEISYGEMGRIIKEKGNEDVTSIFKG